MVRYYGRARQRIGTVNTNQPALKQAGCPPTVGKQGLIIRHLGKRINCNLKTCGLPMSGLRCRYGVGDAIGRDKTFMDIQNSNNPAIKDYCKQVVGGQNGVYCQWPQPRNRQNAGGVGNIWTSRRNHCEKTCSLGWKENYMSNHTPKELPPLPSPSSGPPPEPPEPQNVVGACCYTATTGGETASEVLCLENVVQSFCTTDIEGGNWRGPGSHCDEAQCNGACCSAGGETASCTNNITNAKCPVKNNDQWLGLDTTCKKDSCSKLFGACCYSDPVKCEVMEHSECTLLTDSKWQGTKTICKSNSCTGACCSSDGSCNEHSEKDACESDGKTWLGINSQCNKCIGSCCPAHAPCTTTTFNQCASTIPEGKWRNNAPTSKCAPTDCSGACCYKDGSCNSSTWAKCTDTLGKWLGPGSTCSLCTGACCLPDSSCDIMTAGACTGANGIWQGSSSSCDQSCGICCTGGSDACVQTMETMCQGSFGKYMGKGTCTAEVCAPLGACCHGPAGPSGCSQEHPDDCGGTFYSNISCIDLSCNYQYGHTSHFQNNQNLPLSTILVFGGSGNVTFWLANHLHLEGTTLLLEITWEGGNVSVVTGTGPANSAGEIPVVLENAGGKAVTFKPYWNSPEYQPGIPPLIPTSNNQHYYAGTWGTPLGQQDPPPVKDIQQWGMLYLGYFYPNTQPEPTIFTCAQWQLEKISASDTPIIGRPGILNTSVYSNSDIDALCSTPTCATGSFGQCTGLFYGNPDLVDISNAKNWDLRDVKDMSNFFFTNVDSSPPQQSQLSWLSWTGILTAGAWSTARAVSGGWWPCDVPAYPVKWTGNNAGPADEPGKWFKIVSGAITPSDNTTPNWENMRKLYLYLVLGQTPPPSVPLPSGLPAWPTLLSNYWDISDTPSCAHLGPLPCNDTNCGIGCICKNNACSPDSN